MKSVKVKKSFTVLGKYQYVCLLLIKLNYVFNNENENGLKFQNSGLIIAKLLMSYGVL